MTPYLLADAGPTAEMVLGAAGCMAVAGLFTFGGLVMLGLQIARKVRAASAAADSDDTTREDVR